MINWIKNNRLLSIVLILVVGVVLLFIFFIDDLWHYFQFGLAKHANNTFHSESLTAYHDTSIVLLTILIVLVAYIQLQALNKTGKADFLFRLDQQYGNKSIIKARQIIHRLYLEAKTTNKNACECQHREYIAKEIDRMSNEKRDGDDYILLLNLLDFLETLSYQANKGNIEYSEVKDLMGPSAEFFYQIFHLRIEDRRKKYLKPEYYIEFENLIKNIKNENKSKYGKCCKCNCVTTDCDSGCGCSVLK